MSEINSAESTPRREPRDPSISSLVIRDVAVLLGLLTFWGAGDTWARSSDLAIASPVATLGAALTGLALGALWHEWGHFSGAMAIAVFASTIEAPVLRDSGQGMAPLQALRSNIDKSAFTR